MSIQIILRHLLFCLLVLAAACGTNQRAEPQTLALPEFSPLQLDGSKVRVAATTNIIGDVVHNIGGDAIDLTVLLANGQDPHSYEATPQDLAALENAHVIFVNGWDLEEQLAQAIRRSYAETTVPISAKIEPLVLTNGDEHGETHAQFDPHVWLSVAHVQQWARNAAAVLQQLDPANADVYAANLERYLQQLTALEAELTQTLSVLGPDQRKLVTDHDAFTYFAEQHDFDVVGAVIPSQSTNSEPTAAELVALVENMEAAGVCTIFVESTARKALAETVAAELDGCDAVNVLTLYGGSLGSDEASTYIEMMRYNAATIVAGLR